MVDFVEEVEEQLRAERYAILARRILPWFAAALTALVVGWLAVWGWQAWQGRNIGVASAAYDKGVTALAAGDETGAYNDFLPVAKNGPPAYRALSLMQQGNIRLAADKTAEAVALYDQAAKAAPNEFLGDLARLKAALASLDTAPYPELETRLKAIIGDRRPYDLQAREALAMAKIQVGKLSEARGDLNAIGITLGVTPGMRARTQNAIALIDSGQAKVVADVAHLAATLPPPWAASLGLAGEGAAAPAGPDAQSPVPPGSSPQ